MGYWTDNELLPEYCHEAMKRLLILKDNKIKLPKEPRKVLNDLDKGYGYYTSHISAYPNSSMSLKKRDFARRIAIL